MAIAPLAAPRAFDPILGLQPRLMCPTWVQTNQMKGIDRKVESLNTLLGET
jgi:hypothetical protein